jgi:catechol 2,3-dioxygenase-like lactoylglutathione lyase family enzyme
MNGSYVRGAIKHIGGTAALWCLLGSLALAQSPAPDYSGFDHLTLEVTDLQRSRDFYSHLFGFEVWQSASGEERYLVLNDDTYLRLREGAEPGVRQLGIGLRDFSLDPLKGYLEREQLPWREDLATEALWVEDGDQVRTYLLAEDSWERLRQEAEAPPARDEAPIFTPLRLDEVGLNVTNLEVDALFYARLLAHNGLMQAGSLWYSFAGSRLRLSQTPMGQRAGVGYFSVLIANTDLEAAANAVFAAGGIIETLFPNGFSFWDPDGLRVLVHTTPMF